MTAPAGHVTVVVVPAPVPELHAVEYSDGDPDLLDDRVELAVAVENNDGVRDPLRPLVGERDGVGGTERERERLADADGLADALTILHCT